MALILHLPNLLVAINLSVDGYGSTSKRNRRNECLKTVRQIGFIYQNGGVFMPVLRDPLGSERGLKYLSDRQIIRLSGH